VWPYLRKIHQGKLSGQGVRFMAKYVITTVANAAFWTSTATWLLGWFGIADPDPWGLFFFGLVLGWFGLDFLNEVLKLKEKVRVSRP